jgi:hypothetical protein
MHLNYYQLQGKKYIKMKHEVNDKVKDIYKDPLFRQYKWYGYINKQKSEAKMLNDIGKKFGNDCTIIYGDWSEGNQMKHYIPTPGIALKRKIAQRYTVYNIDEYRTSKLNYKTESISGNISLPDKKGTLREIHSVLLYKTESGRCGYINRDKNAVKNMQKIVNQYLIDRTRPIKYRRGYKILDEAVQLKELSLLSNKKGNNLSKTKPMFSPSNVPMLVELGLLLE